MKVNDLTGEVEEDVSNDETLALAKRELNELTLFEPWLQAKEDYLTAKEKFEMVDVPFKKMLKELFEKHSIKSLSNEYISITDRNGYSRESWDDEKVKALIISQKEHVDNYRKSKWIDGGISIKYKDKE